MAAKVNPLAKIAMTGAGIGASVIFKKVLEQGWQAVFHEDIPDNKTSKAASKDLKARRKQAKKDGASKEELRDMSSTYDDIPEWRIALWTVLSGSVLGAVRQLARAGAKNGTERLISRRPRPNRG